MNIFRQILNRFRANEETVVMREEMERAENVAKFLKPKLPDKVTGLEIGAFHRSLFEASGDWFAFVESQDSRFLHVILCDAAGHGLQAAFVVAACKATLDLMKMDHQDTLNSSKFLEEYVFRLNHVLFGQGQGGLVTAITGVTINLDTDSCYYVGAGNPLPLHLNSSDGNFEKFSGVQKIQVLPGLKETLRIETYEFSFLKGDDLILYSDGIPFPRTAKKNPELFFVESWENVQRRLNELMDHIFIKKIKKQAIGQDDDMTCLWIRKSAEEGAEVTDLIGMRKIS